jgi:hypothetical protein
MTKQLICGEKDYSKFKRIDGNRAVLDGRVEKIIASIKSRGFIGAIVVNEKMEVIDGQGRLEACKQLNVSIDYIIEEGLTIDDCISMNISGTPWNMMDYINSYAARGYKDYVVLKDFLTKSDYSFKVACYAIFETAGTNRDEVIKTGKLVISQEQLDFAYEILDFWKNFDGISTNRRAELYAAILYCYKMDIVDNNRLVRKILAFPKAFETIATITDAIDVIEDCYNNRLKGEHVYIETEYFKMLEKKTNQQSFKDFHSRFKEV